MFSVFSGILVRKASETDCNEIIDPRATSSGCQGSYPLLSGIGIGKPSFSGSGLDSEIRGFVKILAIRLGSRSCLL